MPFKCSWALLVALFIMSSSSTRATLARPHAAAAISATAALASARYGSSVAVTSRQGGAVDECPDGASATCKRTEHRSVMGDLLQLCGLSPVTGFNRDGYCASGSADVGRHHVCARVTDDFLRFTASRGNDLSTPHPPFFPGLRAGDHWCLCTLRWREAYEAGVAPPVVLAATNQHALRFVSQEALSAHAVAVDAGAVAPGAASGAPARAVQ